MQVLLIHSNEAATVHLRNEIMRANPDISINSCREITDAKNWIEKNAMPDLVFMPVRLAGGKPFEIFLFVKITCPVIFITEDDRYLFDALHYNAIGYLQKPISAVKVRLLLKKYETIRNHFIQTGRINEPGERESKEVNFHQAICAPPGTTCIN
jgi:response regulator of citrate/malate metabolism